MQDEKPQERPSQAAAPAPRAAGPTPPPAPQPKPILTKGIASAICGFLSLPSCLCAGIPSLILGPLAIWLGVWVQRNFRGSTASEFANVYAWVGIVSGCIGTVLGLIGLLMLITGGAASLFGILESASR